MVEGRLLIHGSEGWSVVAVGGEGERCDESGEVIGRRNWLSYSN
jgi:hypothetical protein